MTKESGPAGHGLGGGSRTGTPASPSWCQCTALLRRILSSARGRRGTPARRKTGPPRGDSTLHSLGQPFCRPWRHLARPLPESAQALRHLLARQNPPRRRTQVPGWLQPPPAERSELLQPRRLLWCGGGSRSGSAGIVSTPQPMALLAGIRGIAQTWISYILEHASECTTIAPAGCLKRALKSTGCP